MAKRSVQGRGNEIGKRKSQSKDALPRWLPEKVTRISSH